MGSISAACDQRALYRLILELGLEQKTQRARPPRARRSVGSRTRELGDPILVPGNVAASVQVKARVATDVFFDHHPELGVLIGVLVDVLGTSA